MDSLGVKDCLVGHKASLGLVAHWMFLAHMISMFLDFLRNVVLYLSAWEMPSSILNCR